MNVIEQFTFTQFKAVMAVSDIDESTYALILRAVFERLEAQYAIVVDDMTEITSDMVFAIYRHAKFIFEVNKGNLDILDSVSDSSGNKTNYNAVIPKDVMSTYQMYSPNLIAFL